MKNLSNLTTSLTFLLVLVVLLWVMPNQKVEAIANFFKTTTTPISIPLALIISTQIGIVKYRKFKQNKKGKSP